MKKYLFILMAAAVMVACGEKKTAEEETSAEDTEFVQAAVVEPNYADLLGEWQITMIGEQAIDFDATIAFNDTAFNAHVCNLINGTVTTEDGLRLEPQMATKMACPDPEGCAEDAFNKAAVEVRSFCVAENKMNLLNEEGTVVIAAERIELAEAAE